MDPLRLRHNQTILQKQQFFEITIFYLEIRPEINQTITAPIALHCTNFVQLLTTAAAMTYTIRSSLYQSTSHLQAFADWSLGLQS